MTRFVPLAGEPRRQPARPFSSPDYPTLSEHAEARRRFLKLCALSSASAMLGVQLIGCPGGGANAGGGAGAKWVPWDGPQRLAGEAPMPMGAPVAVVVAGGPLSVTFQDGVTAELVVAATVTPVRGTNVAADFSARAETHTQLVQEAAAKVPSSTLTQAKPLEAWEQTLLEALNSTLSSGGLSEVSVARAQEPKEEAPQSPLREAREREAGDAPAEEAAPQEAAPVPPAAPSATPTEQQPAVAVRRAPKARAIWTACRRAGCTTCGVQ